MSDGIPECLGGLARQYPAGRVGNRPRYYDRNLCADFIEECMRRDPKGLYARAKEGKIKNFTGIDSPYEAPENAEIVVQAGEGTPEEIAKGIVETLRERGVVV